MEVQTGTPPAGGAPNSSEHTAAAQNSTPPPVKVSDSSTPPPANNSWLDSFDADTKEYVNQKNFKDPKDVIESFRNLEKLRGVPQERLLKLPEKADDPTWNDVYTKLGKPATPEGYGFNPKDPNNAGFTNWAKDAFHKLNLTSAQGQELVKQFNDYQDQVESASKEEYANKVQSQTLNLKKEWGGAYQQNMVQAQMAYKQLGIPDVAIDSLEKSIGFDGVMKLFHTLGTRVMEHGYVSGSGSGFGEGTVLTPAQAQARIKALKQDGEWTQRYLKKESKAVEEMERLMKMANPTD